ncbi:MAG: hypothetical protein U1A25_01300, partial [Candidatus Sungbacteria bacterium]|nr:hypothetical protein [Candidatus Sungbacteria bacterium]
HKAYERAQKLLIRDRIDPKKFPHSDKAMIARDMEFVRKREAQFKMESNAESAEMKETSTVLEVIYAIRVKAKEIRTLDLLLMLRLLLILNKNLREPKIILKTTDLQK